MAQGVDNNNPQYPGEQPYPGPGRQPYPGQAGPGGQQPCPAPQPYPGPEQLGSYPPAAGGPGGAPRGGGRVPRWAMVAVAVAVAAGAAFFGVRASTGSGNDRDAWQNTSFSMPDTLFGKPQQANEEIRKAFDEAAKEFSGIGTDVKVGVYLDKASPNAVTLVMTVRATEPMSAAKQQSEWDHLIKDKPSKLAKRDPGALGGRMVCGSDIDAGIGEPTSVCMSLDSAGAVMVMATGKVPGGLDAVARVREAVEHRS